MNPSSGHQPSPGRAAVFAATVVLHVLLLLAFRASRPAVENVRTGPTMDVWLVQERPVLRKAPAATAPVRPVRAASTPAPVRPAAVPVAAMIPAAPIESLPMADAAPGAAEIISRARGDIGGIDRDLRSQMPKGLIKAPVMTAQKRLERGIALAAEMAPPKWYEAPKVTEVIDPGGWGVKRYRVITANGTYCLSYESNRNRAGNDPIGRGAKQTMTTCDPNELPPTTQP